MGLNLHDHAVQQFIDAIQNAAVFCRGRIMVLSIDCAAPTIEPNCGVTDECPLFRQSTEHPLKLFQPPMSGETERGCTSFQLFQKWIRSQQRWRVQFEGHDEQQVQARNVLGAACTAWWEAIQSGIPVDKSLLIERRYTVREA